MFQALPAIKEYMESAEFLRFPVNNKNAPWHGQSTMANNATD